MFPSIALQSDAVKYNHVLDKQLVMHCVKKNKFFSNTAPRNISYSNENCRRYNFQPIANISTIFQYTTLIIYTLRVCHVYKSLRFYRAAWNATRS